MNKVEYTKRGTKFADVKVGGCFTVDDISYMRIQEITDAYASICNAINLTDGHVACFYDDSCIDDMFNDALITIS